MRKHDKLIIVDVEATCWEDASLPKHMLPRRDESEIIEIGVCTLDLKTGDIGDIDGIIIKPRFTEISDFCTQLTTITQADVDAGIDLEDGCKILKKKYNSKNRIWASYGQYDANIFRRECNEKRITYPFGSFHINVKAVIETVFGKSLGMADALSEMNMTLDGTHHRGKDDAVNIAKIYKYYLEKMREVK